MPDGPGLRADTVYCTEFDLRVRFKPGKEGPMSLSLTSSESAEVFGIMEDLTHGYDNAEVRERTGHRLLRLLKADYFASYVWDEESGEFGDGIAINLADDVFCRYEEYFQYRDPITPTLQKRKRATPVSAVMAHRKLVKTEFFTDFLAREGMCYGINYYAYSHGRNIGDVRIWRGRHGDEFDQRDADLLDAIGPAFTNAMRRCSRPTIENEGTMVCELVNRFGLSKREAEIARELLHGASDAGIAYRLCISMPTVRSHVQSIFQKCGINRRSQLFARGVSIIHQK